MQLMYASYAPMNLSLMYASYAPTNLSLMYASYAPMNLSLMYASYAPMNLSVLVSIRFLQGELEQAMDMSPIVGFRMIDGPWPLQGELEEAMSVALSASDMAAESLGEKHFKAKAVRKV